MLGTASTRLLWPSANHHSATPWMAGRARHANPREVGFQQHQHLVLRQAHFQQRAMPQQAVIIQMEHHLEQRQELGAR